MQSKYSVRWSATDKANFELCIITNLSCRCSAPSRSKITIMPQSIKFDNCIQHYEALIFSEYITNKVFPFQIWD